jgi:hypothetical protein
MFHVEHIPSWRTATPGRFHKVRQGSTWNKDFHTVLERNARLLALFPSVHNFSTGGCHLAQGLRVAIPSSAR